LNHPVFLAAASDTYLVETIRRGRRGTSMPGFGLPSPANPQLADHEIEAIASFVRSWEEKR
jgi:mono/diheme cytochrome c family protein